MNTRLDHLPPAKRRELVHVVDLLRTSFAEATAPRRAPRLKDGRLLKIILFGSYARGDWVEDPVGRYFSDFDLLVVVDHEDLVDNEFWTKAVDRILDETASGEHLRTPVNFIVHTLDDVNEQLRLGRYFFADIVREGVVLFDTEGEHFARIQEVPAAVALLEARRHYDDWMATAASFLRGAKFYAGDGRDTKLAAFNLHQTAERLYHCVLLVLTLYSPKSHNLIFLRTQCERLAPSLAAAWPHETKSERRCFELLRAAYVKARYSPHYRITDQELDWLFGRVEALTALCRETCERHLEELSRKSAAS